MILIQSSTKLDFKPQIRFTLSIALQAGADMYCPIYLDIMLGMPLSFQWNADLCPYPPLYLGVQFSADLQFRCDGFELLSHSIIDPYDKKWNIYKTEPNQACMFNPKKVAESSTDGKFETNKDTCVVGSYYANTGYYDEDPGKAISIYLTKNGNTVIGTYTDHLKYVIEDQTNIRTNSFIIATDVDDVSQYKIVIDGFEKNQDSKSDYNLEVGLSDVVDVGKEYFIEEVSEHSSGRVLKMFLTSTKGARIDVGKEYRVKEGVQVVCFNGETDKTNTYKIIYKKANEDYIFEVESLFISECSIDGADEQRGKYISGTVAKVYPISSEARGGFTTIDIAVVLRYYNGDLPFGRYKISSHSGTKTAQELGIQDQKSYMAFTHDNAIDIEIRKEENEEEVYSEFDITEDRIVVSLEYQTGTQIITFGIEYTYTTICTDVPEGAQSLMILKDYKQQEDPYECNDRYISVTIPIEFENDPSNVIYIPLFIDGYIPIV